MSPPDGSASDLRGELGELAASVRALLEQHEAAGGEGVLSEGGWRDTLALLDPGAPGRRPAGPRPAASPAPAARPLPAAPQAGGVPDPRAAPAFAAASPRPAAPGHLPGPLSAEASTAVVQPSPTANAPALGEGERRQRLAVLAEGVRGCTSCGLAASRTQTVYARGNPMAELCFIGEGPGADEDRLGEPFVGKAGQLLDKMIAAMGYAPGDVYICNIVKCRPPDNRKPEPGEMAACLPHLHEQLALVQPRVLVALGATAVQGLLGAAEGITRMRGTWKLYRGSIPVMPTFHPAYLLRDPTKKGDVWSDLQAVMKQLGKTLPKRG